MSGTELKNGGHTDGDNQKDQVPEITLHDGAIIALMFTASLKILEVHINYVEGSAEGFRAMVQV